jgi:hypothetical protein
MVGWLPRSTANRPHGHGITRLDGMRILPPTPAAHQESRSKKIRAAGDNLPASRLATASSADFAAFSQKKLVLEAT